MNPSGGKAAATVDLGGSPEFAVADGKGKVFVNIADTDEVAEVDTRAMKVVARWPTAPGARPTWMSMDRATRRLFIGCRNQKLIVMDADSGKVVADFPIGAFVDASGVSRRARVRELRRRHLDDYPQEVSADKFELAQVVKTE